MRKRPFFGAVSCRPPARRGFGADLQELAVVLLEGPLHRSPPRGLGTGLASSWVEKLREAPGQLLLIVRVGEDVPFLGRTQELAGTIVPRRDDRQSAGEGLEHDQGTGIVKRRLDEIIRRQVAAAWIGAVAQEPH